MLRPSPNHGTLRLPDDDDNDDDDDDKALVLLLWSSALGNSSIATSSMPSFTCRTRSGRRSPEWQCLPSVSSWVARMWTMFVYRYMWQRLVPSWAILMLYQVYNVFVAMFSLYRICDRREPHTLFTPQLAEHASNVTSSEAQGSRMWVWPRLPARCRTELCLARACSRALLVLRSW